MLILQIYEFFVDLSGNMIPHLLHDSSSICSIGFALRVDLCPIKKHNIFFLRFFIKVVLFLKMVWPMGVEPMSEKTSYINFVHVCSRYL